MRILFDGRALQSRIQSGVPRVAERWLRALANGNEVTVFTTGWRVPPTIPGVRHVHLRIPNKLLHLSLLLFRFPKLDRLVRLITRETYDMVAVPNLHFFASKAPYGLVVHDLSFLVNPCFLTRSERIIHRLKRPLALMRGAKELYAVSASTERDVRSFTGRSDVKILTMTPTKIGSENIVHPRSRRDFIFLSTTEDRKNLASTIEAYLAHANPARDRLIIIGAITPAGRILQKRFRGSPGLVWLGIVDDATRSTLLARAKALIYPSFFEGFGLPLIEARVFGTAIITSAVTSMPEAAPNAIFIDPHRPETIIAALHLVQNSLRPPE